MSEAANEPGRHLVVKSSGAGQGVVGHNIDVRCLDTGWVIAWGATAQRSAWASSRQGSVLQ